MLSIPGNQVTDCDGVTRREFMRIGGASMLAGLTTALLSQSAALLRRALIVACVFLVLVLTGVGLAWKDLGTPGLGRGVMQAAAVSFHQAPWSRIFRALVVIVAVAIMAWIGGINRPLPKKRFASPSSRGSDQERSA